MVVVFKPSSTRDTYKNLSINNKALVLEFRLAYREFFTELQSLLEQLKPDNGIFGTLKEMVVAPIKFTMVKAITLNFWIA